MMKQSFKSMMLMGAFLFSLLLCFTSCEDILGTWDKPAPAVVTPSEPETPSVAPAATITTAPTATADVKAGSTTELVTAGVADGGTMMYKVTNDNTKPTSTDGFDATVPTAATLAAGTYYVWYYAKADATHSDSEIAATAIEVTVKIPGLLTGVFTVKASPLTKVQFSQGNLQAVIASGPTDTYNYMASSWKFAENQWDYIGNAAGNTTFAANSTVDLFGWVGTSASYDTYGLCTNNSSNNDYYGTSTSDALKSDWGTNMGAGWRTLSKDEWEWLLGPQDSPNPGTNCRTSSTIGGTTNARWVKATVHSKKGLIIFPDEISWDVTTMGTAPTTINPTTSDDFTYAPSDDEWTALAAKGCVFLPAAGRRGGSTVYNAGSRGRYWSSTVNSANNAYFVDFFSGNLQPALDSDRFYGFSVRLVRPAE